MLILTRSSHWTVVLLSCIIQNVCLLYDVLVVLMTSTSICLVPSPFLEKKKMLLVDTLSLFVGEYLHSLGWQTPQSSSTLYFVN